MPIALVVHGGAWAIPADELTAHEQGVRTALMTGWQLLKAGGTALDATEAAVRVMEDDPTFDAGVGSFLNAVGKVEMDAAVMDGRTLDVGAVAAVGRVRNPVTLARHVMATEHVLVVGEGAEALAEAAGLPLCDPMSLVVPRERMRWDAQQLDPHFKLETSFRGHDTVGALALDRDGNLAAAISTGGTPNKLPGRVGDSPLVGSGFYADNLAGACYATGWGEGIMRVVLAKHAVDLLAHYDPANAARVAIEQMGARVNGLGGCIVLDYSGRVGFFHNTPRMAFGYWCEEFDAPRVGTTAR